jgi:hypothetical protein
MPLSDCALITDVFRDCRDSVGGIPEFYVTEFENVPQANITVSSGVVTAIDCSSGKKFWVYQMEKSDADFTETLTSSVDNGTAFYQQVLNATLKKMTAAQRNNLEKLAKNRVMVIVKDRNGLYWIAGRTNGLDMTAGTTQTGRAFGDLNGHTLTLTGMEAAKAEQVTASLIPALFS